MKTVLLLLCFIGLSAVVSAKSREKRFLIVPPTAPTRHQWIAGIGIPLDLENIAVTTGYVLKAQYFLPTKVDDLFPLGIWEDIERPKNKRDLRDKEPGLTLVDEETGTNYTQYNVPAVVIEEGSNQHNESARGFAQTEDEEWDDDEDDQVTKDSLAAQSYWNGLHDPESDESSQNSRWDAYKMLEGITSSQGMGGKHCVLRTICESVASPISHKSGILGEILHILLTPSSSTEKPESKEHQDYVEAEKLGLDSCDAAVCRDHYPECRKSVMDVFTSFENPFETLFNTYL